MKKTILNSIFTLFLVVLISSKADAQGVYISKLHDLEFGEIFIGYDAEVQHTDINAAKFSFYHTQWRSRNVYIQFVLPATLDNGSYKIPITFDQSHTAASYNDQTSGRVAFDPRSIVYISNLTYYKTVYLWLGATINTSPTLKYGDYTGTIILNIFY
jgi:hypothetical protein